MNNKNIRAAFAATVLVVATLLGACGKNTDYPPPIRSTIEESENSFGARYNFTLEEFTENIEEDMAQLDVALSVDGWKIINQGLIDDNGVKYSSYYNRAGDITFTAAVEDECGKVMNIGCGCESARLENKSFYNRFEKITSVTAQHAGGFSKSDLDFVMALFQMLIDSKENELYYEKTLYIKSIDSSTTVLMIAPCSDEIKEKNQYQELTE